MLATVGPTDVFQPTAAQKFVNFLGILYEFGADPTESEQQFQSLAAGTWKHMACYFVSNGFGGTTEVRNRNGGTNGLLSIFVMHDTKGYFESPDTDSVSSGDLVDYAIWATVGGTGGIEIGWVGAHFFASDAALCMIGGSPGVPALEPEGRITPRFSAGGSLERTYNVLQDCFPVTYAHRSSRIILLPPIRTARLPSLC